MTQTEELKQLLNELDMGSLDNDIPITAEQMASISFCVCCDLVLSYSAGKEKFYNEIKKLIEDVRPPYNSGQLHEILFKIGNEMVADKESIDNKED